MRSETIFVHSVFLVSDSFGDRWTSFVLVVGRMLRPKRQLGIRTYELCVSFMYLEVYDGDIAVNV